MRKLVSGLAFAAVLAIGGVSFAQEMDEYGANPTPGACYAPCAKKHADNQARIACIGACCGCAN